MSTKSLTVYSVIYVHFDHHRFEEFLGTFSNKNSVDVVINKHIKKSMFSKPKPIFESPTPLGSDEKDGYSAHYWIYSKRIYV